MKFQPRREVDGNFVTRFIADTTQTIASKLIKLSASHALYYEVTDWEFDEEQTELIICTQCEEQGNTFFMFSHYQAHGTTPTTTFRVIRAGLLGGE